MDEYTQQASTLVEAFTLRGIRSEHFENQDGGTVDCVNVWADPYDRYPVHSIWIDEDGYTWGKSFEFNRSSDSNETVAADVAQAVIETFEAGVR